MQQFDSNDIRRPFGGFGGFGRPGFGFGRPGFGFGRPGFGFGRPWGWGFGAAPFLGGLVLGSAIGGPGYYGYPAPYYPPYPPYYPYYY